MTFAEEAFPFRDQVDHEGRLAQCIFRAFLRLVPDKVSMAKQLEPKSLCRILEALLKRFMLNAMRKLLLRCVSSTLLAVCASVSVSASVPVPASASVSLSSVCVCEP